MNDAMINLVGTVLGSLGGILISNRLTNYRIEQLEKRVELHNKVVERTFILEGRMNEAHNEIHDLKMKG